MVRLVYALVFSAFTSRSSPRKHGSFVLQKLAQICAHVFLYGAGLSPEHRYPSALREAVEAYRYVLETLSIPASKIIIGTLSNPTFHLYLSEDGACVSANLKPADMQLTPFLQLVTAPAAISSLPSFTTCTKFPLFHLRLRSSASPRLSPTSRLPPA